MNVGLLGTLRLLELDAWGTRGRGAYWGVGMSDQGNLLKG